MTGAALNATHECSANIANAAATMAPKAETRTANGIAQNPTSAATP
jgi:hypothetical protein